MPDKIRLSKLHALAGDEIR